MKKRDKIITVIAVISGIFVFLAGIVFNLIHGLLSAHKYEYAETTDAISISVEESIGRDALIFVEKEQPLINGLTVYRYIIMDYEDASLLENLVIAVEQGIQEEEAEGFERKVKISLWGRIVNGREVLASLSNVLQNEDGEYERFDGLKVLRIYGADVSQDADGSMYDAPDAYIVLEDIRYLEVSERIQEQAEEQGISWTDIWPNLRKVEVISR